MGIKTDNQIFEQICTNIGINTLKTTSYVSAEQLFKLFKEGRNELNKTKQLASPKEKLTPLQYKIIKLLGKKPMTVKTIKLRTKYGLRTIQTTCKELEKLGLIIKIGNINKAPVWGLK